MFGKSNTVRISITIAVCFILVSAFRVDSNFSTTESPDGLITNRIDKDVHPLNSFAKTLNQSNTESALSREMVDSETLWLARAIYSETKRPEEQLLVAWVIRNRVETGYRGKRTYKSVILDPYQFSAFRPGTNDRAFFESLTPTSRNRGWQRALQIAYNIRFVDESFRPFSIETRHFFSLRSMVDRGRPHWVGEESPIDLNSIIEIDHNRFQFFEGIS